LGAFWNITNNRAIGPRDNLSIDIIKKNYASEDGDIIKLSEGFYVGDFILNLSKELNLSGGWNDDFSDNGSGFSVIEGSLVITDGSVVIDGIMIGGN